MSASAAASRGCGWDGGSDPTSWVGVAIVPRDRPVLPAAGGVGVGKPAVAGAGSAVPTSSPIFVGGALCVVDVLPVRVDAVVPVCVAAVVSIRVTVGVCVCARVVGSLPSRCPPVPHFAGSLLAGRPGRLIRAGADVFVTGFGGSRPVCVLFPRLMTCPPLPNAVPLPPPCAPGLEVCTTVCVLFPRLMTCPLLPNADPLSPSPPCAPPVCPPGSPGGVPSPTRCTATTRP